MDSMIRKHLEEHIAVMEQLVEGLTAEISTAARLIIETLQSGNKLLIMGNGGSAADAQHMAAELVGRFLLNRQALPAIALTTDSSILTAVGNDFGFDAVFSRQVEALASPGDLLIGISTSGNSANVLAALKTAQGQGCRTIALTGGSGGQISQLADHCLLIPTDHTPYIQEAHLTIIHILCDLAEQALANKV